MVPPFGTVDFEIIALSDRSVEKGVDRQRVIKFYYL